MTPIISIILATFERPRFLEKALAAIERSAVLPHEVIVWDNGSADETRGILAAWEGRPSASPGPERRRVVRNAVNVGIDAYGEATRLAGGTHIVVMDDDVIDMPAGWDRAMVAAFEADPRLGFLAADVVQDETTSGGRPGPSQYTRKELEDGIIVDYGPAGGWLAMTPRRVFEEAGGFPVLGRTYYHHDGIYSERVIRAGYRTGVLAGVKVYHACDRKASELFGYASRQEEKEAERFLLEADRLAQEWKFPEAATAYRSFLFRSPGHSDARSRLAHVLMMTDRFDEAEEEASRVLEESTGNATASIVLGMIALRRGEAALAEDLFRGVLFRHPEHPRARALLGVLLARTGRSGEAADNLVEALCAEAGMAEAARVLLALASDPAVSERNDVREALSLYARIAPGDEEFARRWGRRTDNPN